MEDMQPDVTEFGGKANVTSMLRWALYYKGKAYQLPTGKVDKSGAIIMRTAYKGKTRVYEHWSAGSVHPQNAFSEQDTTALRLEVHRKSKRGDVEVVWWQDKPANVKVQWLVLSPMLPNRDLNKKLPVYIRGLRLISKEHGTKEFFCMEGI